MTATVYNKTLLANVHIERSWTAPQNLGPYIFTGSKSTDGNAVPSYKSKIAKGINASSPYTIRVVEHDSNPGSIQAHNRVKDWTIDVSGDIAGYLAQVMGTGLSNNSALQDSQKADWSALGSFLSEVANANRPFMGLVALAEIKDTLGMISSRGKSLYDLMGKYLTRSGRIARSSGGRKTIRERMRDLNDLYLEATFGWTPLIQDIKSGSEAYIRAGSKAPKQIRCFGSGDASDPISHYSYENYSPVHYIYVHGVRIVHTRYSVRYYGAVSWEPKTGGNAFARNLIGLAGFDLQSFIPTLWELVPYSFVVDYFTNVGDILTAACTSTSNLVWHCRSRRTIQTSKISGKPRAMNPTDWTVSGDSGTFTALSMKQIRDVPGLGIPGLVVQVPDVPKQWLNLTALFLQSKL